MRAASKVFVVTGGSGFVGSHLLADLASDDTVSTIYVLDQNQPSVSSPKIHAIPCDLREPIAFMPDEPVDACIHLAAICREPGFSWDEYFTGNYLVTRNVVEWAKRCAVGNLIFTSTAMVFHAGEIRHAEGDLPDADTAYGISKALAEEVLHGWKSGAGGRRLRIVRPGVVFGKGGGGNFARLHDALKFRYFFYVGRDSTVKSAIYVKDLVRLLRLLVDDAAGAEIHHGVYPEATTTRKVCDAFCEAYGWRRFIPTLPFRLALLAAAPFHFLNVIGLRNPIHIRRIEKLYFSTDLSAENLKRLGFEAKYSLTAAISDWRADCAPGKIY